jgi:hypothetical protein
VVVLLGLLLVMNLLLRAASLGLHMVGQR